MPTVLLIGFYNTKALGLRCLETALTAAGYDVRVLFFKNFNSIRPEPPTPKELDLISKLVDETQPSLIGLSVMATLYLETVKTVNSLLRKHFDIPVLWGGVYATMFPEQCLEHADFVIRGEGEAPITELMDTVINGKPYTRIKNLAYRDGTGVVINEMRPLMTDLDAFGFPYTGKNNKYLIENNILTRGDPQQKSRTYELTASRGCPFSCSYCCSAGLRDISQGCGAYVRFRDVDKVIDELKHAKSVMKKLSVIRFWDEIFCDNSAWVKRFSQRYREEINIPFEIWGHPSKIETGTIKMLMSAGLYKVVTGIQSGSPYIRKEIFNRHEKQEDIIRASQVLADCHVPQIVYDFMLRHPFETPETMLETYELCTRLAKPFELQLHGLSFLPGTEIVKKALERNLVSRQDMERLMYSSIREQYNNYWISKRGGEIDRLYDMVFLTQFPSLIKKLPNADLSTLVRVGRIYNKIRNYKNKGKILLRQHLRLDA